MTLLFHSPCITAAFALQRLKDLGIPEPQFSEAIVDFVCHEHVVITVDQPPGQPTLWSMFTQDTPASKALDFLLSFP